MQAPALPAYLAPATPEPFVAESLPTKKLGIVFKAGQVSYPWFTVDAVQGDLAEDNAITGKLEKVDLTRFINLDVFSEDDRQLVQQLRKLSEADINKFLTRNSPFSGFWENIVQTNGQDLPEETRHLINDYLQPKLQRLIQEQHKNPAIYFLPEKAKFVTANLAQKRLAETTISPYFFIQAEGNEFVVRCMVEIDGEPVSLEANEWESPLLLLYQNKIDLYNANLHHNL